MKDLKLFLISTLESIFIVLFLCCLFLVYLNYSTKNHTNYEISKEF